MLMRLCVSVILWLSCAAPTIAQAEDQFYVLEDFSKMLQSHTSPYSNPDGVATDVLNVRANIEANSLSKRYPQLTYGTCLATAPVKSLFRYYKSDATKYTIENIDQYIYSGSDSGGACTTIGQGNTVGKRWDWVTYKDVAIGSDGYDAPVKWDGLTTTGTVSGARTSGDLVTQLGAPFAKLATGTGLDTASWYQYKVAFYNSSGQWYYSTARSNPIKTDTALYNTNLTDIPLGQTGTTKRAIYRTLGQASRANVIADTTFYVDTVLYDNSTTTWNDTHTDATIINNDSSIYQNEQWADAIASGVNMTPPYGKHLAIVNERLLMANRPDGTDQGKSTVYVSEAYNPDLFNTNSSDHTLLIRPDDGDEITMQELFLGQLFIGKDNSISKIYIPSSDPTNWYIGDPTSFVGVSAPYSVASTPNGIIYLNRHGLYLFDGQSSNLISDAVTKEIRNISPSNIPNTVGVYWNNEYDLAYSDLTTGLGINDRVLIYDFARKSYTKDSKYVDSWAKFDSGDDYGTLYSGTSQSTGVVSAQSSSTSSLTQRYKSQIDEGTFADTASGGTEDFPTVEIAWIYTVNDSALSAYTIDGYPSATAIVNRPGLVGSWTSTIYEVNASTYDKLYWNATLGSTGSLTYAVRSASTEGGIPSATWSSEFTNPSGSDISGLTANTYVQFRATLTTTDINYSPYLSVADSYLFKMTYSKIGTISETSVLGLWQSGFQDINSGSSENPKIIKEADIYYTGDSGTITFQFENLKGDILADFTLDLSHVRDPSAGYFGNDTEKVFRYNFPIPPTGNYVYGDKFRLRITEDSTSTWKIQRMKLRYSVEPYVPYR